MRISISLHKLYQIEGSDYILYGVVLHFDSETNHKINNLWGELNEEGISSYANEIENRKPHLTIADYSDLEESSFKNRFCEYYDSTPRICLTFSMLGTFIKSGALFLSPNPTMELLEFHFNHHHHFKEYNLFSNSTYNPEKWIPHCTIANRLSDQKLLEALHYSTKRLESIQAEVQEISLIKLQYKDNKRVVETILSKEFI